MLVYPLCMLSAFRGVCYLQTFMLTSFKNIFLVSDRVLYTYVIISSSLKLYQNFGPDLSQAKIISGVANSGDS